NVQHRTSNVQHRTDKLSGVRSTLSVGCSMFDVQSERLKRLLNPPSGCKSLLARWRHDRLGDFYALGEDPRQPRQVHRRLGWLVGRGLQPAVGLIDERLLLRELLDDLLVI